MQTDEKYIAMLYEKIVYDATRGIFIFKPIEVMNDCEMDFTTNILTSNTKKQYLSMEDEVIAFSEENYCYGYPLLQSDLQYQFPDTDIIDIAKEYYMSLSETIIFGVYDKKLKKIRTVNAATDDITMVNDDGWFFDFEIEEDENVQIVNIPLTTVAELIDQLDKKEYETVHNYFNNIKILHEKFESGQLVPLDDIIKEQVENAQKKEIKPHVEVKKQKDCGLDDLIGLEDIKNEVKRLFSYLNFLSKSKDLTNIDRPNLNMVFTGNPGTGKTTVARIIANLLYEMGYLRNQRFSEITPREMIAGYVGQTASKAASLIRKNEGGVIFVDEAYIFNSKAQEFGQEAIVEIIKEMEKKDTVFIFAGYKDEMRGFIRSNPGITSRIGTFIAFNDYSNDQLYQIFEYKTHKAGMKIADGVKEKVYSLIDKARKFRNFGNGRFIDKLFEKLLLEHAVNTEKYRSKKKLITFTEEDFSADMEKRILFEMEDEFFGKNGNELESVIKQLTEVKTEEYLDQVVSRIIYERLYNQSYDIIRPVIENTIKDKSDNIIDDVKKYIKKIEKGRGNSQLGFKQ